MVYLLIDSRGQPLQPGIIYGTMEEAARASDSVHGSVVAAVHLLPNGKPDLWKIQVAAAFFDEFGR